MHRQCCQHYLSNARVSFRHFGRRRRSRVILNSLLGCRLRLVPEEEQTDHTANHQTHQTGRLKIALVPESFLGALLWRQADVHTIKVNSEPSTSYIHRYTFLILFSSCLLSLVFDNSCVCRKICSKINHFFVHAFKI
jgi:hypothetical protein